MLAIDGDGIFDRVRPNNAAGLKSTPNTNFYRLQFYLVNLMWVVITYTAILFVYIAIHPKMHLITKDNFSAKIGVLFQTLKNPFSEHTALFIIINFEVLGQLNLVRV